MADEKLVEMLAERIGVTTGHLRMALDDLHFDLTVLGGFHRDYVATQHEAFLRGVESADEVLSGNDTYGEHATAIHESLQKVDLGSKIRDFDDRPIGRAVKALVYRDN
jgi:hypothetical protein